MTDFLDNFVETRYRADGTPYRFMNTVEAERVHGKPAVNEAIEYRRRRGARRSR